MACKCILSAQVAYLMNLILPHANSPLVYCRFLKTHYKGDIRSGFGCSNSWKLLSFKERESDECFRETDAAEETGGGGEPGNHGSKKVEETRRRNRKEGKEEEEQVEQEKQGVEGGDEEIDDDDEEDEKDNDCNRET